MDTEEIVEKLNYIKEFIINEENEKAIEYIDKMKQLLLAEQNRSSDYIENLVKNLK